ncbi:hypothetical protein ACRALDRAFT_212842 [Sodiomyces alcalophilus JCM 7366]|uniref:uncharacterized protein n=1 Tax=Sodiomyces alcalophilus JCM 7366 TaxID=591952 RepID=UPI0039B419FE
MYLRVMQPFGSWIADRVCIRNIVAWVVPDSITKQSGQSKGLKCTYEVLTMGRPTRVSISVVPRRTPWPNLQPLAENRSFDRDPEPWTKKQKPVNPLLQNADGDENRGDLKMIVDHNALPCHKPLRCASYPRLVSIGIEVEQASRNKPRCYLGMAVRGETIPTWISPLPTAKLLFDCVTERIRCPVRTIGDGLMRNGTVSLHLDSLSKDVDWIRSRDRHEAGRAAFPIGFYCVNLSLEAGLRLNDLAESLRTGRVVVIQLSEQGHVRGLPTLDASSKALRIDFQSAINKSELLFASMDGTVPTKYIMHSLYLRMHQYPTQKVTDSYQQDFVSFIVVIRKDHIMNRHSPASFLSDYSEECPQLVVNNPTWRNIASDALPLPGPLLNSSLLLADVGSTWYSFVHRYQGLSSSISQVSLLREKWSAQVTSTESGLAASWAHHRVIKRMVRKFGQVSQAVIGDASAPLQLPGWLAPDSESCNCAKQGVGLLAELFTKYNVLNVCTVYIRRQAYWSSYNDMAVEVMVGHTGTQTKANGCQKYIQLPYIRKCITTRVFRKNGKVEPSFVPTPFCQLISSVDRIGGGVQESKSTTKQGNSAPEGRLVDGDQPERELGGEEADMYTTTYNVGLKTPNKAGDNKAGPLEMEVNHHHMFVSRLDDPQNACTIFNVFFFSGSPFLNRLGGLARKIMQDVPGTDESSQVGSVRGSTGLSEAQKMYVVRTWRDASPLDLPDKLMYSSAVIPAGNPIGIEVDEIIT